MRKEWDPFIQKKDGAIELDREGGPIMDEGKLENVIKLSLHDSCEGIPHGVVRLTLRFIEYTHRCLPTHIVAFSHPTHGVPYQAPRVVAYENFADGRY